MRSSISSWHRCWAPFPQETNTHLKTWPWAPCPAGGWLLSPGTQSRSPPLPQCQRPGPPTWQWSHRCGSPPAGRQRQGQRDLNPAPFFQAISFTHTQCPFQPAFSPLQDMFISIRETQTVENTIFVLIMCFIYIVNILCFQYHCFTDQNNTL